MSADVYAVATGTSCATQRSSMARASSGRVHAAAVADPDPVEPRPRRVRPVLAEHRDAHRDETLGEPARTDVPLFEGARTEVLDDDVGRRREPPEDVLTIAGAQVERHALAA